MENDYISEELAQIIRRVDECPAYRDKILYLEELRISNEQSDLMYGVETLEKDSLKYIEKKLDYLYKTLQFENWNSVLKLEKIQWKGSPALFGYLFLELVKNGFIEPPLKNGEPNYAGLAKLCFNYFNVNNTDIEYLIKQLNPNSNLLSDTKRAKFTIPNLSDLA